MTNIVRCEWAPPGDALYLAYHDEEWGMPSRDDCHLFELLVLEGAQAGLSWATILRKREGYRAAFADFDAQSVAGFGQRDVERLLDDSGIVRNRAKIESAVGNARATLAVRRSGEASPSTSGASSGASRSRTSGVPSPTFRRRPPSPGP